MAAYPVLSNYTLSSNKHAHTEVFALFCRQMEMIDSVRDECWQESIPEMACLDPTWKGERKKLDTLALRYETGRLLGYEK